MASMMIFANRVAPFCVGWMPLTAHETVEELLSPQRGTVSVVGTRVGSEIVVIAEEESLQVDVVMRSAMA